MHSDFRYVSLLKTETADRSGGHTITNIGDKDAEVSVLAILLLRIIFKIHKMFGHTEFIIWF
jgi:hypothetical protein